MKEPAVIFDRDGTLASVSYIAPQDRDAESWRQYNAAMIFDAPAPGIVHLARVMHMAATIIVVSGRMMGESRYDFRRRYLMEQWLSKHKIPCDELHMRRGGDYRIDSVVKAEIYEKYIAPRFDVIFVIDDRPQVIAMWESKGLVVYPAKDPGLLPMIAR